MEFRGKRLINGYFPFFFHAFESVLRNYLSVLIENFIMALYLNQYADADAFSAATAVEGRCPLYKANTVGLITGGGNLL